MHPEPARGQASQTGPRVGGRIVVAAFALLSVAAVIVIMFLASRRPAPAPPIALRSKSVAGATSAASRDHELSFYGGNHEAARLVVVDAKGRSLAPIASFARADGDFRLLVAPRSFVAHEGEASAVVLAGSLAGVVVAAAEIEAALQRGPLTVEEIVAIAERHALAHATSPLSSRAPPP